MKQARNRMMLIVWLVVGTLVFAHFWLVYPDVFPRFPPKFSLWLINLYGAKDGEDLGNLEELAVLILSFVLVSMLTWLSWRTFRLLNSGRG
jgi:hypothetical protein